MDCEYTSHYKVNLYISINVLVRLLHSVTFKIQIKTLNLEIICLKKNRKSYTKSQQQ